MKKVIMTLVVCAIALVGRVQTVLASAELGAENVNEIRVQGSFCDVYANNGDQVYFKGTIEGRGDKDDFSFDTEIVGSTLVVRVARKHTRRWRSRNFTKSRIDLTIPPNVKLMIDNSSGDISVNGLKNEFSKIEASSGDIRLRNIHASLDVETSSGDIEIEGMDGELNMKSTSGDQQVYQHSGAIDTRASSGDITLSGFNGKLVVEAVSGDIRVKKGNGSLDIRTTSGNISGRGIELSGNVRLRSSSGTIKLDFENDLKTLSFDLAASSGDLRVGSRLGERQLTIQRGGYLVTGVTSSGDQSYDN